MPSQNINDVIRQTYRLAYRNAVDLEKIRMALGRVEKKLDSLNQEIDPQLMQEIEKQRVQLEKIKGTIDKGTIEAESDSV